MTKTLFDVVVPAEKVHPSFHHLLADVSAPARLMLDDVYQDFEDPDGNFLEQFQSTGFDARFFELYLHAYFSRSGFEVTRPTRNPDFLVRRGVLSAAVEATTINRATSGPFFGAQKNFEEMTAAELAAFEQDELPIRFGGPLYSKMQKKYWELPICKDLPFVIAIEAFHQEGSLFFSDAALQRYLYGEEYSAVRATDGTLTVHSTPVMEHKIERKTVPSKFFAQLDTRNISAVIFTNSGTHAKFARMGYQTGLGTARIAILRMGTSYDPEPDAMDPSVFSYSLDRAPLVESWAQGLVVFHNPNALRPIPRDFFVGALQGYVEDGVFKHEFRDWHPIASRTHIIHVDGDKESSLELIRTRAPSFIHSISKDAFRLIAVSPPPENPIIQEHGWFTDIGEAFLGAVIYDRSDSDWGWVVLARDQDFRFRAIDMGVSLTTRQEAVSQVRDRISEFLGKPQRIFPQ